MPSYERARASASAGARPADSDAETRDDLGWTDHNIGLLQQEHGRPAEALASYERARALRERLVSEHPESMPFAADLATTLGEMASIDLDEHRFDKARTEAHRAVERRRKVLAADPEDSGARQLLVDHLSLLIRATRGWAAPAEAAEATRERDALLAGVAPR